MVQSGTGWLGTRDAVYFAVLALMIGCRRYDFLHGDRRNLSGEDATETEVRRYMWMWGLGGVVAWGIAYLLGNHILE